MDSEEKIENEPNSGKPQISVTSFMTSKYVELSDFEHEKNEPNFFITRTVFRI